MLVGVDGKNQYLGTAAALVCFYHSRRTRMDPCEA